MTVMGGGGADSGGETAPTDVLPRCFFDLEIGGINAGRVIFELFTNLCPKTCENFRQLCTGEGGVGKTTAKPLHYKGTVFHRCIKDFMIQGGDFSNFNGTGGESIYGGTFEDENLQSKHDEPYMLSMANRGPNTNGSQFFILTQPAPHLNGIHVVFGRVVTGQGIIKQIEGLPVDRKTRPLSDVRISNCGELVLLKKKKDKKPKKEKKKKEKKVALAGEDSERSSGELSESSDSDSGKKRKKKTSESVDVDENKEVAHPLATLSNIDPEDIPKDPPNRFLMRAKDLEKEKEKEKEDGKRSKRDKRSRSRSRSGSRNRNNRGDRNRIRYGGNNQVDNAGRKIKGRGRICFPRFTTSRSRSKTPPHWKAEARKTISMKEFEDREKRKRDKDDELKRRQDERKKRHEAQYKGKDYVDNDEKTHKGVTVNEKPSTPVVDQVEESTKIVEELTSQIQAAGDGVVYYQHLYRKNKEPEAEDRSSPEKVLEVFAPEEKEKDEAPDSKNAGSGEDLLVELRLRRELLKKRLKEWEESSGDEEEKGKGVRKRSVSATKSHHEDDKDKDKEDTKKEVSKSPSKEKKRSRRDHSTERGSRHGRKSRSHSKSKSKSRSKSRERDRRDKSRRDSSRDKNRRDRDRDHDRRRSDRRRSRSRSRSRGHRRR